MTKHISNIARFFNKNGYFIEHEFLKHNELKLIQQASRNLLNNPSQPIEYEVDVNYPGAPESASASGGNTIRRILQMYDRHEMFSNWAKNSQTKSILKHLLADEIFFVRSHHNSLMTKHPKYSSQTNWHRDIRYWNYSKENLISVWLALGNENKENGALMLIPGSHRLEFERRSFDESLFFRKDLPENQALINSAISAELSPGDVLFFHCRTLHAASANQTKQSKYSLVNTYRPAKTHAVEDTRSAELDDVKI